MSITDIPIDDFLLPDEDDCDAIDLDELARAKSQRDQYLRLMCIFMADMSEAAFHLFGTIARFGQSLDPDERAKLLECHARLIWPEADLREQIDQMIEHVNARALDPKLVSEAIAERRRNISSFA